MYFEGNKDPSTGGVSRMQFLEQATRPVGFRKNTVDIRNTLFSIAHQRLDWSFGIEKPLLSTLKTRPRYCARADFGVDFKIPISQYLEI